MNEESAEDKLSLLDRHVWRSGGGSSGGSRSGSGVTLAAEAATREGHACLPLSARNSERSMLASEALMLVASMSTAVSNICARTHAYTDTDTA